MKYYSYVISEDDVHIKKIVYSEAEILAEFWNHWSTEMKGAGFANQISKERCIEDWCLVNWATPEDVYKFRSGYEGKLFCINEFNIQDPTFNLVTLKIGRAHV